MVSPAASWSVSISCAVSARPEKASTTSKGELVRSTGISSPSSSWPLPAGLEREVHGAEDRLDLDGRAGLGAERGVGLDPERHLDVVAVELDALDLADPDAGDPDLVLGLEAAGLGERRGVAVAAADQRQVLGPERGQQHQDDHGDADRPDDHRVALAERLAHPRSHLGVPVL